MQIVIAGSGCKYMNDTRLRRCVWAWVICRHKWGATPALVAYYGRRGTLRDMGPDSQTVPGAEREAIREALYAWKERSNSEEIVTYSDCRAVVEVTL